MTMRYDATRLRIPSRDLRRGRAVVPRQGQVLLDTDFSEQSRDLLDRIEIETVDILNSQGRLVYPAGTTGFQVTAGTGPTDFVIGAGHGYIDGWLLENPAAVSLATQPHPIANAAVAVPAIIAFKSLVRHIDPVEDLNLADVALGDAQASGRALIDWQIFPVALPSGGQPSCANVAQDPGWTALRAQSTGLMTLLKQSAAPSTDPCSLTPGGGYSRLENLLYRVEVHGGKPIAGAPTADGPRFGLDGLVVKFSRRNASLIVRVTQINGSTFDVEPAALDPRVWFAPGVFAEIVSIHDDIDPSGALANERLFRVKSVNPQQVELDATAAQMTATAVAGDGNWFLRLWDAFPDNDVGTAVVAAAGADSQVVDLGDGLSVQFHDGGGATYRRGDYWTFAARADGSIDWPGIMANTPQPMTPHGPEVRYAALAVFTGDNPLSYEDCRVPFANLTDKLLFYRGGEGQSVFPAPGQNFVALPEPLRVAVMRGQTPVVGAVIRWAPVAGAPDTQINGQPCTSAQAVTSVTDANGLCEVAWSLDAAKLHDVHRVSATLEVSASQDLANFIDFGATFSTAKLTGYEPGACPTLANVNNVQDALDTLCANLGQNSPTKSLRLKQILLRGPQPTPLVDDNGLIRNALEVPATAFLDAIEFLIDSTGLAQLVFDPLDLVAEITLDIPYPSTDPDRTYWTGVTHSRLLFGFQQIRLDGSFKTAQEGILWMPSAAAKAFLQTAPVHQFGQRGIQPLPFAKIPCRLRLRSALIWAKDPGTGEPIYLNAEHLGAPTQPGVRPLFLKQTDPQRSGDLDIYIFLTVPTA